MMDSSTQVYFFTVEVSCLWCWRGVYILTLIWDLHYALLASQSVDRTPVPNSSTELREPSLGSLDNTLNINNRKANQLEYPTLVRKCTASKDPLPLAHLTLPKKSTGA
ncbi:WW domain-containing oxidoreductase [Platysternon megacephalum]|uniref:WW domain-containing oxidoreductase n=1 Tax=Platysternon megacephalum TaxID=55544 RepID=A0A4D9EE38_9SAUR|nr:WW domain-containing oxidoreductase [Platysternon megacephalum]